MGKKRDQVIEMMKDQFMASRHDPSVMEDAVIKHLKEKYEKDDKVQQERVKLRKQKELEAKQF